MSVYPEFLGEDSHFVDKLDFLQAAFVTTDKRTERFRETEDNHFHTLDRYAQAYAGLVEVLLSISCKDAITLLARFTSDGDDSR